MKATLNEISDQLHLCAALMSNPHIIRTQSHVVASQFVSAARRIEQLQTYLVKPGGKLSPEKPWFDKSILSGVSHAQSSYDAAAEDVYLSKDFSRGT